MEWDFSADEVVRGEVAYGLEAFRADLLEEIRMNMPELDSDSLLQAYRVLYDLCYWLATGKEFEAFLETLEPAPPGESGQIWNDRAFLEQASEAMGGNIEMLGAILQRAIMDGVERGLSKEEAVEAVARYHEEVASQLPENSPAPSRC